MISWFFEIPPFQTAPGRNETWNCVRNWLIVPRKHLKDQTTGKQQQQSSGVPSASPMRVVGGVAVLVAAVAHFSWLGASKSPLLKLDWEEVNWPNLCLSSNLRGQFPPLGWRALVDKDILHSSIHPGALRAMQLRLAEDAACLWRSILEEEDEFNYLHWQKSPPSPLHKLPASGGKLFSGWDFQKCINMQVFRFCAD